MQMVIFDLDETIFADDAALYDDVDNLLAIVRRLGARIGALSSSDHRVLVRLEEAGIRNHFDTVVCAAHVTEPKSAAGIDYLLQRLDAPAHQTVLISHRADDMTAGKEAGVAKTVYVLHAPLSRAENTVHADHIVENIAAVLDVLE